MFHARRDHGLVMPALQRGEIRARLDARFILRAHSEFAQREHSAKAGASLEHPALGSALVNMVLNVPSFTPT